MSSPALPNPRRWRVAPAVIVVVSLTVVTALAVGWAIWSTQQQWDQLDDAADDFRVPPGFTEVARPRQGSGFCWVTCTNGGEAVITIVLATDHTDPMEACRALRPAIVGLTGDAADASHLDSCGWVGELGGSASVFASAGRQQDFRPHDGHRWTDAVAVPESPVVAFVEFNSGLE